jgi:basic amino acid/polyamine antiporter, APA family
MIGAGIFSAAAPAAQAAGNGLLIGVAIAGLIALLNAMTMSQLASVYPESGGTYVYGRKLLGPIWGFIAGWGFVIGKLASCTAMALTFGYYASPEYAKPLAASAVVILTAINYFGVKKTAVATKVILSVTLICLAVVIVGSLAGGAPIDSAKLLNFEGVRVDGIMRSAGLMFFAFAGYARIATLGEEVIDPRKTIPRAVITALSITFIIYLAVIGTALMCIGSAGLASSKAPLVDALASGKYAVLSPIVRVGACFASIGVLLSLLAGIGRTAFAMASNGDLPRSLSAVHSAYKIPHHAELWIGAIVTLIVLIADIRSAIGFSSFAILIYYAIANISALKLASSDRLWPRWLAVPGAIACLAIACSLPFASIVTGLAVFGVGVLYYSFVTKR